MQVLLQKTRDPQVTHALIFRRKHSATLPAQKLSTLNTLAKEKTFLSTSLSSAQLILQAEELKLHLLTKWPVYPILQAGSFFFFFFFLSKYRQKTGPYFGKHTGVRRAKRRVVNFSKLPQSFTNFSHATARSEHYWLLNCPKRLNNAQTCTKSHKDGQNHTNTGARRAFFTNARLNGQTRLKTGDLGTLCNSYCTQVGFLSKAWMYAGQKLLHSS